MDERVPGARLTSRVEFEEFVAGLDCSGLDPTLITNSVLDHFVQIVEPQYANTVSYITLDSRMGGSSRKPGNLVLNWRRLFDTTPDVVVAGAGVAANGPFVRAMIGLYIWNKVWRSMEEPITIAEASIIEGLWCGRGGRKRIPESEAFDIVNKARRNYGMESLTFQEFAGAIDHLVAIDSVELKAGDVRLTEWVRRRT